MASLEKEICNVGNSLGFQVASKANIRSRLNNTANKVFGHKNSMDGTSTALQNAVSQYERVENIIIGNMNVGKAKIQNAFGIGYEAAGVFGAGGKTISTVGKFLTSDKEPAAKWTRLASDVWKIGDVIKTCKSNTNIKLWKVFTGTNKNKFLECIESSNLDWKGRVYHGWNEGVKGTVREFKTAKGLTKQVGTIALSVIINTNTGSEQQ